MINVIAHRTFHFREFDIVKDKNDENVAILKNEIIIAADPKVQKLPEWVKKDELFDMATQDGTLQEVTFVPGRKKPILDNRPKGLAGIPRAQFADPNEAAEEAETGKVTPKFDDGATPLGGQISAGVDWPKNQDPNGSGLAG